ncbi:MULTISPECIES: hypothetical protein [Cupriavidus]|uniref:hypothetical protein n=1 Tax=Cupriavidus sp. DF5525 TaxID=3160989 RepID=UPI0032DF2CC6
MRQRIDAPAHGNCLISKELLMLSDALLMQRAHQSHCSIGQKGVDHGHLMLQGRREVA